MNLKVNIFRPVGDNRLTRVNRAAAALSINISSCDLGASFRPGILMGADRRKILSGRFRGEKKEPKWPVLGEEEISSLPETGGTTRAERVRDRQTIATS